MERQQIRKTQARGMHVARKAAEQLECLRSCVGSREPRWLVKVQGEPQRWGTFGGSLRHPEPAALQQVQGGAHTIAGPGRGLVCARKGG